MFFKRKSRSTPPPSLTPTILLPLYVYPSPGAWAPLFDALTCHPNLKFTIIVNPASGPGTIPPDEDYSREIPRLNSYSNVRTIGYVSTVYAKRALADVLDDIEVYAKWAELGENRSLGMQGIFLDETPSKWDDKSAKYLQNLGQKIKSIKGFGDSPLIVHNPGTIPDARYLATCDQTVVFEGAYVTYHINGVEKRIADFKKSPICESNTLAVIIHSIPSSFPKEKKKKLMQDLRILVGSVFVTGLAIDYYSIFWDGWRGFVEEMDC